MITAFGTQKYTQGEEGIKSDFRALSLPKPTASGRDILVKVKAVSTNPIDVKKLSNFGNVQEQLDAPLIPGWDASGIVEAVGDDASIFNVGDEVYFAGSLVRHGSFADYILVDERIVGYKPKSLNWVEAAALPLTSLTSYELFRSFGLGDKNGGETILIVSGAGGVGSIGIQIAKKVFGLKVVATASRDETIEWVKEMGADHVINHHKDIKAQLQELGINQVDYSAHFADLTQKYLDTLVEVTKPFGKIGFIMDHQGTKFEIRNMMFKSISLHGELMYTASLTGAKIEEQGEILNKVSNLVEAGSIKPTLRKSFKGGTEALRNALIIQDSGKAIGKIGVEFL